MDITYLIALMPQRQPIELGLPDDPMSQCATTIPLQQDMVRIIDETRTETMVWTMSVLLTLFMVLMFIQEKCK